MDTVMDRLNCWGFMRCGKEPGGTKVEGRAACPASTYRLADGMNGGKNGGRMCWAIAGNLCGGESVGVFVPRFVSCKNCAFYKKVAEEQGKDLIFTIDALPCRLSMA